MNWNNWRIQEDIKEVLRQSKSIVFPKDRNELINLSLGGVHSKEFEVGFDVEKLGYTVEANIVKCKNGLAVNYIDSDMRRRDPECMVVNNISKTDKESFKSRFGYPFEGVRTNTLDWLKKNDLIILPFMSGGEEYGYPSLLIAPKDSAFMAISLYDLQHPLDLKNLPDDFEPKAIIYLAPPFRHTHFQGKQVVVHNQNNDLHEIFAYNLYPGPSAKKGVYGVLLALGVKEGWVTVHGSTVKVVTPYDNEIVFLHEGASGSGKSEMLEYPHRSKDGRLKLGENILDGDKKYISLGQSCKLFPVTDDMALCHPKFQQKNSKLVVKDAEEGWFIRVNHIQRYGTDFYLENTTIHPQEPLIFLNIKGQPDATCLIWEHIEDKPGVRCPNPRVIIPRKMFKGIQNEPVEVDYRSFGLRTPPTTKENPSYGIFGIVHILPPALAWLWRLVAPRGFSNPSIIDSNDLESEGVGSYWPFATGRRVDHANILLEQIMNTPKTRYILIPNQHIGAWKVGFMAQWVAREYLARRGQAAFRPNKLVESRCILGGYVLENMQFEGSIIPQYFVEVNKQPEIGDEGYDKGSEILYKFFAEELEKYLVDDLNPLGRKIIENFMSKSSLEEYEKLISSKY